MAETAIKMNVYKLQKCRVEIQKADLKKSGENKFSKYTYYELGDFLPKVNELMDKYDLTAIFQFGLDEAKLIVINTDNVEEYIEFSTPITVAELKGTYAIQNFGATQTYARRYLYIMAFEIAEADSLDQGEHDEELILKGQKIDLIKVQTIKSMLEKTKADEKIFLKYYKIKSVEDITNGMFQAVMNTLQKKLEDQEKEKKDKSVDLGI